MKLILCSFLLLLLSNCSSFHKGVRPISEMHGGCSNYKISVDKVLKKTEKTSLISSTHFADKSNIIAPLGQWIKAQLHPNEDVSFRRAPRKKLPKSPFSGIITIIPDETGLYHLGAQTRLWFELVDKETGDALPSHSFEMQTQCRELFKVVTYQLLKGKEYFFQLSSSKVRDSKLIVFRP